jgi:hypothetical protein
MTPNVVAETPELGHGDTDARPNPEPKATSISPIEAIAKAPPIIAPQETADTAVSAGVVSVERRSPLASMAVVAMCFSVALVPEQREQQDYRYRHSQQPE